MKLQLFACCLFLSASTVFAVTYKWEDSDGMHFTDNASSIPEKYRSRALDEAGTDSTPMATQRGSMQPRRDGLVTRQDSTTPPYTYSTGYVQAQQNQDAYTIKPKTNVVPPVKYQSGSAKLEKTLTSGLFYIIKLIVISLILFVLWQYLLVDIIRSEFKDPNNKVVWIILMVLLAPIAVLLYLIMGSSQKIATQSNNKSRSFNTSGPSIR